VATPTGLWIHVDWGKAAGKEPAVMGPFTGEGVIQLNSAGVKLYPSKAAAEKAPAQKISTSQGDQILKVNMAGPGIGQGFFGLGSNVKQLGQVGGITEIGHFIGVIASAITDGAMWRSLGWISLGGILLVIGLFLWLKDSGALEGLPIPVPV
jgi:hypothetical protein